jgi:DNA mismatch endonuclease (patch repair protein)
MRANRSRDTSPELAVRRALHRSGLRYRVAYRALAGSKRTVDVAFTRCRVAVLIDGCFWHGCPEHYRPSRTNASFWSSKILANQVRDRETSAALEQAGWTVLRFWEHEDAEVVAEVVGARVRASSGDRGSRSSTVQASSTPSAEEE